MSVVFNAASSQHLSISAPRPELASLTAFTFCCWFRDTSVAAVNNKVVSFSTGTAAGSNRAGIGMSGSFAPTKVISTYVRRTDGGSQAQPVFVTFIDYPTMYAAIMSGTTTRIWAWTQPDIWSNAGAGGGGAISATSSLAAAIGALADGSGEYCDGEIEELRLYNVAFVEKDLRRLSLSRGRDRRSFMHPNLLLWWQLRGSGTVTTATDKKAGVVATAVAAPVYGQHMTFSRRRNRGG